MAEKRNPGRFSHLVQNVIERSKRDKVIDEIIKDLKGDKVEGKHLRAFAYQLLDEGDESWNYVDLSLALASYSDGYEAGKKEVAWFVNKFKEVQSLPEWPAKLKEWGL
jgi:hypothetical protein